MLSIFGSHLVLWLLKCNSIDNEMEYKMALSFKERAIAFGDFIYNLPSTIASGTANIIFGNKDLSYARKQDGSIQYYDGQPVRRHYKHLSFLDRVRIAGLVGLVLGAGRLLLDAASWLSHQVSAFVRDHETAIKRGFWIALAVASVAAATAALVAFAWPAAFAALTGYTLLGVSIASLAGPSLVAQIFVSAGLAAAFSSMITAAVAGTANTISYIKSLFSERDVDNSLSDDEDSQFMNSRQLYKDFSRQQDQRQQLEQIELSQGNSRGLFQQDSPSATLVNDNDSSVVIECKQ